MEEEEEEASDLGVVLLPPADKSSVEGEVSPAAPYLEAADGVVDEPLKEAESPTPPPPPTAAAEAAAAEAEAAEDPPEAWTNLM